MIPEVHLQAALIGGQGLRRERHRLGLYERARVHAAALVAGGRVHIGHDVGRELVLQGNPVVGPAPVEVGLGAREPGQKAVVPVRVDDRRSVGVVPIVGIVLGFVRVANASRQIELVDDMPSGVGEYGFGVGRGRIRPVLEVVADPGQPDPRVQAAVLVQVETTDGVVERRTPIAGKADFLAHRMVDLLLQQDLYADGRTIGLLGELVAVVLIARDRFQGEVVGDLVVDGDVGIALVQVIDRWHADRRVRVAAEDQ